ncbi:L-lactate dehydrogenase [Rhodocytophaga rosea]|uniref:L-lactate dehydrogenase n=1 Tax=Rhodocytophaga rosea TaxID=2704465 RepID=A0A6C0GP30_9BACT|nr:L-lactate dehydrogenase [Rhodocytophaga rosea]QHT69786.1 L-lactate dehydrogenase [Rhodocytophaga rosea]
MKIIPISPPRVFVIGAGMVGATAAYTLLIREIAWEIVLIDVHQELAEGQVMDMNHASAFGSGVRVRTGNYSEIRENDIIVITSGASQQAGEDRHKAAETNANIIKEVVAKIMKKGVPVFILMVTNPVDVLTYVAYKESGLPAERIFGTGTSLDTARLRFMLSQRLKVNASNTVAFILGEHGDTSFPALSAATIEGIPLKKYTTYKEEFTKGIMQEVRESAYKIVADKKATYYGIGSTVADLVAAIIENKHKLYAVSGLLNGEYGHTGVAIGIPALLSGSGVKVQENYPLNSQETRLLHKSVEFLKESIKKLGY